MAASTRSRAVARLATGADGQGPARHAWSVPHDARQHGRRRLGRRTHRRRRAAGGVRGRHRGVRGRGAQRAPAARDDGAQQHRARPPCARRARPAFAAAPGRAAITGVAPGASPVGEAELQRSRSAWRRSRRRWCAGRRGGRSGDGRIWTIEPTSDDQFSDAAGQFLELRGVSCQARKVDPALERRNPFDVFAVGRDGPSPRRCPRMTPRACGSNADASLHKAGWAFAWGLDSVETAN